MKFSREQKKQNATDIMVKIDNCHTGEDIDRVGDMLDELMQMGAIYKRAYDALCEELDCNMFDILEL